MTAGTGTLQEIKARPILGLAIVLAVMGAANLVVLTLAAADRSWVAAAIGIIFGPLMNLFVAAVLLAFSLRLPGWRNMSRAVRVVILATLAFFGAGIDFLFVSSLKLHGC
jgi:hypothetical protein